MYSFGFHAAIGVDVGGIVRVCLHGYGGVWVIVGLFAVEMGGVYKVEVKGYGLGVSAEYNRDHFV